MAERSRRMARVLDVQRRKSDLAEWRLAATRREIATLEGNRADAFAAIDDNLGLHGLFVDLLSKRIATIDRAIAAARDTEQRLGQALLTERRKARLAELLLQKVRTIEDAEVAKAALSELLETVVNSPSQASEKLRGR